MNELSKYLVEQILLEDENPIKKTVVIYVGRFQPFHKGHYATYQHLVKKFGKNNVYIGTSNKVEKPKSPFNFKEKKQIMTTMFGVPSNKIYEVKNPYAPTEILKNFDETSTAFITVVGEKDSNRLGGKYFTPFKGKVDEPYKIRGYVYASPAQPNAISGTDVRNGLSVGSDEQKENFFTNRAYGKFNKTIFKMITDKLNEGVIEIPKERIENWLINESSAILPGGLDVDDGPNFFFPNYDVFSRISAKRAAKIGYEVVNMIMSKDIEDYYDHPNYPNGPTKSVSYFPAGVIGAKTPNNQIDVYSSGAYTQWFKHATRKASLVGYTLVMTQRAKEQLAKDKSQSGDGAKGDKELKSEFEKSLNEAITLPVEIGDTLLMGKFKNKKVVVKSIGKDEHGMPTINGKKVVTFRLMKEGKQVFFEDEKEDEKYTHVGGGNYKLKGKEKDPNSPTFQKDDSGKYTELDGGGDSSKEQPKTGTALKTKDMQARVAKEKEIEKRLNGDNSTEKSTDWTDGKDGWEILDDKRSKVKNIRKYSDDEYKDETGEYFENDATMKVAPNAFKDEADMIQKMKNAKPVFLSSEEMQNMSNTDVGDILDASGDGGKQSMIDLGKERAKEYGKDWDRLEKGIQSESPVPAPMALRDKNGNLHLLAGNTRLMSFTAFGKKLPIKVIDYDGEFQYNESINEIAGTAVQCEICDHSWEIEINDEHPYLCHVCGWDSQQQEYDFDEFEEWKEENNIDESSGTFKGGKLRPYQLVRRKFALAGKGPEIARKKKRTMLRKKPLSKLVKIAYKMAYRQVYDDFAKKLFPNTSKSDLTLQQTKVIHRNVIRKKGRVIKRAKFKFLPMLRAKESEKFGINVPPTNEMSMAQLKSVEKYAEKQLSPEDIEFTKHFFDRVNDPRNGKEISDAELTGFFKRLSKHKKQFKDFLEKYKQIVVKDKRYDINIPFVKSANQIIAKTVMRKDDFKSSDPILAVELAPHGYPDQKWMDNHEKKMKRLRKQLDMMSESIESDLSNKYKVDLDIYEYQTHIELRRIVVPQDQRGKGIGSKVMEDLIKYAKSNNKDLFTTPSSDFGGSKSRLIQFYKSFGFKDNKGSNRDFRSKESMVLLVRK